MHDPNIAQEYNKNTTKYIEQTKSLHHHQILSDSSDSSNCMSSKLTKRCTNLVSVASL